MKLFFVVFFVFVLQTESRLVSSFRVGKTENKVGNASPFVNELPTVNPEWQTEETVINSKLSTEASPVYDISGSRSVVVDSNNKIHVVFVEELDSKFFKGKLMYSHSEDDGLNWSAPQALTKSSGPSSPQLALDPSDDSLYVAFLDRKDQSVKLFLMKSVDSGRSWSQPNVVVNDHVGYDAFYPTVQVDDLSRLHLTWHEADRADESPKKSNVFYSRSVDGGMEFDIPTRLNSIRTASAFSRFTLGGSTGSLVASAWSDFRNGQWDIMLARSYDAGLTWEELPVLPNHSGADFNPDLLVTVTGELHLVWHNSIQVQNMPVSHVLYASSMDFGETWSEPRQMSASQGRFPEWVIKTDSSAIAVFWLDEQNFGNAQLCPLPQRCSDVALAYSVDGGEQWEATEFVQYEGTQSIQSHSAAFFPDGRPIVVWSMIENPATRVQRVFTKVRKTPLPF